MRVTYTLTAEQIARLDAAQPRSAWRTARAFARDPFTWLLLLAVVAPGLVLAWYGLVWSVAIGFLAAASGVLSRLGRSDPDDGDDVDPVATWIEIAPRHLTVSASPGAIERLPWSLVVDVCVHDGRGITIVVRGANPIAVPIEAFDDPVAMEAFVAAARELRAAHRQSPPSDGVGPPCTPIASAPTVEEVRYAPPSDAAGIGVIAVIGAAAFAGATAVSEPFATLLGVLAYVGGVIVILSVAPILGVTPRPPTRPATLRLTEAGYTWFDGQRYCEAPWSAVGGMVQHARGHALCSPAGLVLLELPACTFADASAARHFARKVERLADGVRE